jgi:hypothetical protein
MAAPVSSAAGPPSRRCGCLRVDACLAWLHVGLSRCSQQLSVPSAAASCTSVGLLIRHPVAAAGKEVQERADPVSVLGRVAEQVVRVDLVTVPAAVTLSRQVSGRFEIRDDRLHGALGESHHRADIPHPSDGIASDLYKHVAVSGQQGPASRSIIGNTHASHHKYA